MRFGCILADPPWQFEPWSRRGEGKSAARHYACSGAEWIAGLPVRDVAASDSVLLLWATWPLLPEALRVMAAWGFEYKSGLPWIKLSRRGAVQIGCGYHVRGASELLLIGTRGNPQTPAPADRPSGVLFCGRDEHSRKPDTQYEIAEGYAGPWMELFSRPRHGLLGPRDGWTYVGDAVDGKDAAEALRELARHEEDGR